MCDNYADHYSSGQPEIAETKIAKSETTVEVEIAETKIAIPETTVEVENESLRLIKSTQLRIIRLEEQHNAEVAGLREANQKLRNVCIYLLRANNTLRKQVGKTVYADPDIMCCSCLTLKPRDNFPAKYIDPIITVNKSKRTEKGVGTSPYCYQCIELHRSLKKKLEELQIANMEKVAI